MTMYQVVEYVGGKHETYLMGFENDKELSHWLNGKCNWINEKKDSILAWKINPDGYGYIDLEKYWNRHSLKAV